jgi:choline kinase
MSQATRNVSFIKAPNVQKYSIIIPAAGMGVRMKSFGVKPLIKLKPDLTVLQNQLNIIDQKFRYYEIILVVGFQAFRIMKETPQDIIKIENERYEETNICRSIGMGLRAATTNRVLIINGDLVFNSAALNVKFNQGSALLIDTSHTMTPNEVGCTVTNKYVDQVLYELEHPWSQISFFVGKELEMLKQMTWEPENERLYTFEIINRIIDMGGKFKAMMPPGIRSNDIDTSKDIAIAQDIVK